MLGVDDEIFIENIKKKKKVLHPRTTLREVPQSADDRIAPHLIALKCVLILIPRDYLRFYPWF